MKRRRPHQATRGSGTRPPAARAPRSLTPPPLLRDGWALAPLLAALLVAVRTWYPFVGEPVADDFDFLQHRSSPGPEAWLDGGGSRFYWRPLARQLYYRLFGGLMLDHPAWIAALQVVFLALAGWLLYRALRRHWPAPWAAAAASFPILIEAGRTLIATPTSFQDLGAILFSALALQQAASRHRVAALGALLAALLCKEMAAVTALALPLIVPAAPGGRRERLRWAIAAAVVVTVWAAAYAWMVTHAGLWLARDAVHDPRALEAPWLARLAWAAGQSLRDAMSLPALSSTGRAAALTALVAIAASALLIFALDRSARERVRARLPWAAGGLVWFALTTATLADVHPDWRPYRSPFGGIGLGVACTALLGSLRPALLAALVALRLTTFVFCPGPPAAIAPNIRGGYALDFAKLVQLQRLTGETRRELIAVMPSPVRGARVANNYYPLGALHALAGDRSLHVWYGDTTLHWIRVQGASDEARRGVAAVLQFQPTPPRQIVPLTAEALWHLEDAAIAIDGQRWGEALSELSAAESFQRDPEARVFASMIAGKRALALGALGRHVEADRAAGRSLELWDRNADAQYAHVVSAISRGRLVEAESRLDRIVRERPGDAALRDLLADIRRRRAGGGR